MKLLSNVLMSLSAIGFAFSANAVELADGKLSIGGFADGQYQYTKNSPSPGFRLNDAAIYLKAGNKKVDLNIDLPFSGGAANNDFSFATGKAQAYVALHPSSELSVWMGQFDTIFGYELNDTKDITFTTQGLIYANNPVTHQGALVGYSKDGITAKALVSNPNDSGTLSGANLEFGGQVGYTHNDMLNIALGYLGHNPAGSQGFSHYLDIVAGFKANIIDLDAEFVWNKDDGSDADWGTLVQAVAQATDEMSFGARGEFQKNFVNYQDMALTVGPQFKPSAYEGLSLKADYTWNSAKADSTSDRVNTHGVNFAMLYAF